MDQRRTGLETGIGHSSHMVLQCHNISSKVKKFFLKIFTADSVFKALINRYKKFSFEVNLTNVPHPFLEFTMLSRCGAYHIYSYIATQ